MNVIFVEKFNFYKKRSNFKTIGGIETNTNNVINELRLRGHNVWIVSKEPEPESSNKMLQVFTDLSKMKLPKRRPTI